ncbi:MULTISPECIES: hypothetical protein [Campylobacter]|uniref:Uncharacterized protein n=1 Tax=Campylobacter molothri TaxID=1032242 RepID=A0ACC5W194_9BACT|nr:hypothetical protein [Campylobacter sp. RM10537]MBZ7928389.1 hypothetical protein [Campylobacter sp. RM10542]MBZ7933889.1 hypothetical protein [Campylobacter sp. W0065]MBZ7945986.1 hypothetical protein [Campylobacter sp. RM10536]MBZ7947829.1 hypothetical protein [Campylobacter sp. RM9929]MBZ7949416.1 hypothetical protein [Campylobacter sp. RM10534]MBZ7955195.1 hypothetical protein [Campylobacter sp. RM17709]MBZ7956813.1 hypothetical protein [Campylobacter sp. RM10541]MBZ7958216.1 hypothe
MTIDNTKPISNTVFSSTKIKEKTSSADEFQANLNEVKNKENKEKISSNQLNNKDLDLGAIREDFRSYAWQKMREDQYKKNEETLLNKLFATIDAGNAANKKI